MLSKIWTNMSVKDVNKTVEFYQDVLNFEFVMGVPMNSEEIVPKYDSAVDLVYCLLKHGNVEMMFQESNSLNETVNCIDPKSCGGTLTFYFETDDIEGLFNKVKGKAEVVRDIHQTFYGMKEFYCLDCNGYVLGFSQPVEQ